MLECWCFRKRYLVILMVSRLLLQCLVINIPQKLDLFRSSWTSSILIDFDRFLPELVFGTLHKTWHLKNDGFWR